MTPLERFATEVLNCGIDDLVLLKEVYSPLANEIIMDDGWEVEAISRGGSSGLNSILYELYQAVKWTVQYRLEELSKEDDELKELVKKSNIDNNPQVNCLDSRFDSDLDQVIDWNSSVNENVKALIQYWKRGE